MGDTVEADKLIENEFFDTREMFLSICQSNYYQFDTLRKAKYSSMMLLYHLHNPASSTLPVTVTLREDTIQEDGYNICPSIVATEAESEKQQEKRESLKVHTCNYVNNVYIHRCTSMFNGQWSVEGKGVITACLGLWNK